MMRRYTVMLFAAASMAASAQQPGQTAQTEVMKMKTAEGKVIRYEVNSLQELSFGTLFHTFDGYMLANGKYFQNYFAGSTATLSVYQAANGYDVHISDAVWGEAEFENCYSNRQLSGTGTITVSQQYGGKTYEATISGAMNAPVISIPQLMQGGTTLSFLLGRVPESLTTAGNYSGADSVTVGGTFGPYVAEHVAYHITANQDGTINVEIPEFKIDNTQMGDLTLGKYTVSNIAYDEARGAFFRDYKDDGMLFHFKAESNGQTTMDNDYPFTLGNIEIKNTGNGIRIENNFQMGSMPFPIVSIFRGYQETTTH